MKFLFESLMSLIVLLNLGCSKGNFEVNIYVLERISHDSYELNIELYNDSDTNINFWLMTCSWEENFLYSTNEIMLEYKECPKNNPYLLSLMPGEKLKLNGILKVSKTFRDEKYRLGFVLIKEDDYSVQDNYNNILEKKIGLKKDIFWSNSIALDKVIKNADCP